MFKEIKDEHTVAWRTISNKHIGKNGMLHKNAACIFTRKVLWHDARVNIAYIQTHTHTHIHTSSREAGGARFTCKFPDRNRVLCGTFSSPHFNKSIDLNSSIAGINS